jgi:hypothetical protein
MLDDVLTDSEARSLGLPQSCWLVDLKDELEWSGRSIEQQPSIEPPCPETGQSSGVHKPSGLVAGLAGTVLLV